MDGRIIVEEGSILDVIEIGSVNFERLGGSNWGSIAARFAGLLRRFHQYNPVPRARRNVAHHYDLSSELYRLFLDSDRQYSCAYFPQPTTTLDEAQLLKKRHLAAKLLLRAGTARARHRCRLGRARHLLRPGRRGRRHRPHAVGRAARLCHAPGREAGLEDRVRFLIQDYRETTGTFDRIVSVGMLEHVGVNHYDAYFRLIADRLAADGVAVIHSIGRAKGPPRPRPSSASTSSPAAISRPCPRSCPPSSGPGSGSPMSRSCGCTMPTR
jgi:cyclopropane-fatty-acyl-phospholipid synthase